MCFLAIEHYLLVKNRKNSSNTISALVIVGAFAILDTI